MVEPGRRRLGDRYELERLIATGGMGQVWRAQDVALHRTVAVKVLRSEYTGDPSFLARFRAEAQHAASLSHPNTAAVFDYGEAIAQDGTGETLAFLVMELVEGEPLSALIAREGRLGTATTLSLLRQTAFALAEAHRAGMVHRDVKPGNILVRPDGSVKITDFGIAWSARSVALTRTGQVIGTPQYLSPEQAEGRQATPASDVYALGLIGYECLVGRPAFDGDNAVTIALKQVQQDPDPLPGTLPEEVRELVCRAVEKDPAARWADGAAFVAAIEAVLEGRPLPAPRHTVALTRGRTPAAASRSAAGRAPRSRTAAGTVARTAGGSVVRAPAPRRGRLAVLLLPLLGLVVGAGIAAALFQALSDDVPGSPAEAAELEQQPADTLTVDAAGYVGRPVEVVTEELAALGLDVRTRQVPTDDSPPGLVTEVTPDGVLQPGDAVVVAYTVRPGTGGAADEGAARTGTAVDPGGSTPAPDPTGASPSATTAPTTTPSSGSSTAPATTSPSGTGDASGTPTGGPDTAPGSDTGQTGAPTSTPPAGSSAAPSSATGSSSSGAASSSPTSAPPSTGAGGPGSPSGTSADAEGTGG